MASGGRGQALKCSLEWTVVCLCLFFDLFTECLIPTREELTRHGSDQVPHVDKDY